MIYLVVAGTLFPRRQQYFSGQLLTVLHADTQRAGQGEPGSLRLASALPIRREHPRPQIRLHRHPRHRRTAQTTAATRRRCT